MLFYNGCCLAIIKVVTLIDAPVTDRPEIFFVLCDEPFRFHWISFQALKGLHTNILCTVDDD